MLLDNQGIVEDDQPVPTPIPFADVVSDAAGGVKTIVLKEIHSVSGVNALVPDQSITFALEGLTVIYGENGAGKSGYARIFKHACHAREKSSPILGNVSTTTKQKAQATIELSVNDEDIAVQWTAGTPTSDLLAEIAVFDSHCARVFLDEANEVVYLPYGMDVFRRLSDLCESLKKKVQATISSLPAAFASTDQFRATLAGTFVRSLSEKTDLGHLDVLIHFTDVEKNRLQSLKDLVATAKANPPKQQAAELRRKKQRLVQIRSSLDAIATGLAEGVMIKVRELASATLAAAETARLASSDAFQSDPLPGTGKDPWRNLFDAAKAFSMQAAYPEEAFPVVRDGALCLLCQQSLSVEAADRLTRFQQFVVNDAATKKAIADQALAGAVKELKAINVQPFTTDETILEELRTHKESLAIAAERYAKGGIDRKNALLKAIGDNSWDAVTPLPMSLSSDFKAAIDGLEQNAAELDKADNPDQLKKLQDELAELEDRSLLAKVEKDVRNYVAWKKRGSALRLCEKACDTTAITKFGSQLMESAVTEQLIAALKRETAFFGLKCVPIGISKKGEKGKTKHQLTIQNGVAPTGVLSEGEQRVVAITAFLAELDTAGRNMPIIFDDPVSSLDHLYRERVAKRLTQEAKDKRQVVVFTHDIVMLLALERECGQQSAFLQIHTVRRSSQGPGECPHTSSRPWHATTTKERIGFLKNSSAQFKKLSQDPDAYRVAVAELFGKLRESWERAIEELLFGDVIQRFRPSIETQRLKRVTIDSADYAAIERGMAKCSAELSGHDTSAAINAPTPTPDEVGDAIKQLESFVEIIQKRQNAAGVAADSLTKPLKPALANGRATKIIETGRPLPIATG